MGLRPNADRYFEEGFALGADPLPDETQAGFVARLAERQNGYTTRSLFAKLGLGPPTNRFYEEAARGLAKLAGTSVERIRATTLGPPGADAADFRGRRLPLRMFDLFGTKWRRACPLCLQESLHHRCWWDVQVASACPVHGLSLVDHCPRCSEPLRWLGHGVGRTGCVCNVDIRSLTTPPISEDERSGVALLHGFLGHEPFADVAAEAQSRPPFADLDDSSSADFMIRFALDLLGRRSKRFSAVGSLDFARQGHRGLAIVVAATSDWPGSFHAALDGIRRSLNPEQPPTPSKVTAPMRVWVDGLPDNQGRLLAEAVNAWMRQ
ncbi:MAG TPA: TniQ family protein [Rariglobus sp.]